MKLIQEQFSLEGKTALVTGASSGIGHELAKGLAGAGATIVAAARRSERLAQLVEEIRSAGGTAIAASMDVTDLHSIQAAYDSAEATVGAINIIVNNAGVGVPEPFLKTEQEGLDFVMDTNFGGVWHVAQEGARRMVAAGTPGSIINIASILGMGAARGYTAYCASKGAVIQLTRAMALDLMRHRVRVNAIAPGWFMTEMNKEFFQSEPGQTYIQRMPARRLGQVSELLGPVLMLASDAGSFVNGVVLPVDGAHTASLIT